jgi:transposase
MMNENNSTTQRTERKRYSPQFKDQALARAEKIGVPQAAEDLGIPATMLYSWRAKLKQGGQPIEQQKLQQAELSRLKREVNRLEEENAFLKKVATYFTKESK